MQNMTVAHKIRKARSVILETQPFYGTILCGLQLVETDNVNGQRIDTMAVDGRSIFYNTSFIESLPISEVVGVLCHEVMHVANGHHLRRNGRDPMEWNIACDYAINPHILMDKMALPKDGLFDDTYKDMGAEAIYARRKKDAEAKSKAKAESQASSPQPTQGSGAEGNGRDPSDQPSQSNVGSKPGSKPAKAPSSPGVIMEPRHENGTPMTAEELADEADNNRVKVIQAGRISELAGSKSGGASKLILEAKTSHEDWRDVLRKFVSAGVENQMDQTWSRISRRSLSRGEYLPGYTKESTGDLVIIKDTSGSIEDAPNAQFDAEIRRIVEDVQPDSVTIIACDAQVKFCKTYMKGEEIHLSSKGGGGTRFSPAFAKIVELDLNPKAIIYFTDMICSDWGVDPGCPVLWCQWGVYKKEPPFGEVLKIKEF